MLASEVTSAVTERAARGGLDLVAPFSPAWLAPGSPEALAVQRLGEVSRGDVAGEVFGLLFASSRAIWGPFSAALAAAPELSSGPDPFDRYVEREVATSIAELGPRARVAFAHEPGPDGHFPIQRLAAAIGLAALSPSHLSVHPRLGPWVALRAVAMIEGAAWVGPRPTVESPCEGCAAPCVAALELARRISAGERGQEVVTRHPGAWIAVRDACPVGREARYGEAQMRFHYARELPRFTG